MAKLTKDHITEILKPVLKGYENALSEIQIDGPDVFVVLNVNPEEGPKLESLRQSVENTLNQDKRIKKAQVILTAERQAPNPGGKAKAANIENLAPDIKHIIAVASGKGGVGKSTIAANLAAALSKSGLSTGLLDADIYGPSVPKMFGLVGQRPKGTDDQKIIPFDVQGLKIMSIGFMVDQEAPLIWRGPMVQTALKQLLQDVAWGPLDVLIVDMPPGTGDAQLTLAQKVPLAGAVIVSTPQDIALIDARKGYEMFKKMETPILGMIENMSVYCCPNCGHESHIFGHGGAREEAEKLGAPLLGEIPINLALRQSGDNGLPFVVQHPEDPITGVFEGIAETVKTRLGHS